MLKRLKFFHVSMLYVIFLYTNSLYAAPAAGLDESIQQPDGSIVHAISKGDEWLNWMETAEGFTIAKAPDNYWYYVTSYDGKEAILSDIPAHKKPPAGVPKGIKPHHKQVEAGNITVGFIVMILFSFFFGKKYSKFKTS